MTRSVVPHFCVLALVLPLVGCAGGGAPKNGPSTSTGIEEDIACSSEVPSGALVKCVRPDEACASGESVTYIVNAGSLPAGTVLTICGSAVPAGWGLLSTATEACCPSGSAPNAIRIEKLP